MFNPNRQWEKLKIQGGMDMHLDELLSKEIQLDFDKNLEISEETIKKIIHQWPDQIYDIIIMFQNDLELSHYVFQLPDASGVIEFDIDRQNNKINIMFHSRNELQNQRKFKNLLGEVYADIIEDQAIDHMNYMSVEDNFSNDS
jgi:hypothetical protein